MLTKTHYKVNADLLQTAVESMPLFDFKQSINQPTGDFFYDPWKIKPEFKNSVWKQLLETVDSNVGEARIIVLKPATNYQSHADIDDRYHLNLTGESCFLIDLNNQQLHPLISDCYWYEMNAGNIHTAANFGRVDRIQLVVRKLLHKNKLQNPIKIRLSINNMSLDDSRFVFDNTISPWLNSANKSKIITDFKFLSSQVSFAIEHDHLTALQKLVNNNFYLEIL